MLGDVNKLFVFKSLLTMPSNVLPLHLKQTFPPIIWIFTEVEGDGIESRLPFKIFYTLMIINHGWRALQSFIFKFSFDKFFIDFWNNFQPFCMHYWFSIDIWKDFSQMQFGKSFFLTCLSLWRAFTNFFQKSSDIFLSQIICTNSRI